MLLTAATVVALVWVNSPAGNAYTDLWDTTVGPASAGLDLDLRHWINDGLMTVFFFVIGLELKQELVDGELAHPRAAALPVLAAIGGAVVPAGMFLAITWGSPAASGWGVPIATDPAFAVGILALLARRVPATVRLLLLAINTVDDVLAVAVIAVGYNRHLSLTWLGIALAGCLLTVVMRRCRVTAIWPYLPVGGGIWYATLQSGVHPSLAGVALALLTPTGNHGSRDVLAVLLRRLAPCARPRRDTSAATSCCAVHCIDSTATAATARRRDRAHPARRCMSACVRRGALPRRPPHAPRHARDRPARADPPHGRAHARRARPPVRPDGRGALGGLPRLIERGRALGQVGVPGQDGAQQPDRFVRGGGQPVPHPDPVADQLVDVTCAPAVACRAGQHPRPGGHGVAARPRRGVRVGPPRSRQPQRCPVGACAAHRAAVSGAASATARGSNHLPTGEHLPNGRPFGWGDSAQNLWMSLLMNGLSCSAHTDAQPRPRSPTRHDANRSARVRCRPRSTSVATPSSHSAVSARCTVRTDNPVSAASRSLVGRLCRPVP